MGPIVRAIGSGIGFASEAIASHKQQKADAKASSSQTGAPSHSQEPSRQTSHVSNELDPDEPPPLYRGKEPVEDEDAEETIDVEEDWELDEAAGHVEAAIEPTDSNTSTSEKPDVRKITQKFLTAHPKPADFTPEPLPTPVIIPQRRPRTKSRGFVRAYAPVLAPAGIDQETWMDFLSTFQKASEASPIFAGILVAGHLVGYVPSVSAMIASTVIQTSAMAAIVLQSRSRTNTFLDAVNEHFFRPRGLYALLIQYRSSRHRWSSEALDISHAVSKGVSAADAPKSGNMGAKFKHNLAFGSGKSHTNMEMPEAAPLIYPALDEAVEAEAAGKPSKVPGLATLKSKTAFTSAYFDRRAQATFEQENPDSSLNPPDHQKPHFASRYADPTHPASSGSLIALVTGGKVDPHSRKAAYRQAKTERRGFQGPIGYLHQHKPVRRIMRQGVLYLMIVNMPSETEIAKARAELEKQVKVESEDGEDKVIVVGDEEDDGGASGDVKMG